MCLGFQLPRIGIALALLAILLPASAMPASQSQHIAYDLSGKSVNPFEVSAGKLIVLLFVRTDCPISNRYAPTIQKLSAEFGKKAAFWLVYPDRDESADKIRKHDQEYGYSIGALRDTEHSLVKAAEVTITPEAAVFTAEGHLVYHGRIDNWYVEMGRARSAPTTHELQDAIEAATKDPGATLRTQHAVGCYIADLR